MGSLPAVTFTAVTFLPVVRKGALQSIRSINSSVRLHNTSAFDLSVRSGLFSIRRTETPYRARSAAIAKPTGPAPAINTFEFVTFIVFFLSSLKLEPSPKSERHAALHPSAPSQDQPSPSPPTSNAADSNVHPSARYSNFQAASRREERWHPPLHEN